ncbi:hypothetical protein [Rhodoferax aquaticus]|uniref:Uncharacterized protein n=1 Tax=Rhodoferax aquaticus TaxID=2527691 RepID=A0A515EL32_9BURK|nr:hypothetical protein [Rhodoferax aquaticus]QDL53371.1 hypothetical protein EXZ61_03805 [Rhodoferax aquaticus]
MRSLLGLIGVLVTLALVGLLFKQQLTANRVPQPLLSTPTATITVDPKATAAQQSQQIQNQVKQQVEVLTQPKPMPDEVK